MSITDKKTLMEQLRESTVINDYHDQISKVMDSEDKSDYEIKKILSSYACIFSKKKELQKIGKHLSHEESAEKLQLKDQIYKHFEIALA